jgi:hypothetical protein
MKHSSLLLAALFITIHAYSAAIDITRVVTPLALDCDTILLTSGSQFTGEIIEEQEDGFKVQLCDSDRLVLIAKRNISEIRTASGEIRWASAEWRKQLPTQEGVEEPFDPEKKRKLTRQGVILILLALALAFPFGYLAFIAGGASFLGFFSLLVPLIVLIWGIAKLTKGRSMRKQKKKEKG